MVTEAAHVRPPWIGHDTCDLCEDLAVGGECTRYGLHLWLCAAHLETRRSIL